MKCFYWDLAPLFCWGLDDRAPCLSEVLDPPLDVQKSFQKPVHFINYGYIKHFTSKNILPFSPGTPLLQEK